MNLAGTWNFHITAWGRFDGFGGILEVLRGILRTCWWQLISFLQPCKAKMAPRRPREAKILLNIANFLILRALRRCLGPILDGLGGVLEALEGVLKASSWRLGDQHEPRCPKIEKS